MGPSQPPSSCARLFLVGRDRRGRWVVQDQARRCGGLFVSRAEAVKFALSENGHDQDGVVSVSGVFELDLRHGETARSA